MCQCRAKLLPERYVGHQIAGDHDIVERVVHLMCYIVIGIFDDGTTTDALAIAARRSRMVVRMLIVGMLIATGLSIVFGGTTFTR